MIFQREESQNLGEIEEKHLLKCSTYFSVGTRVMVPENFRKLSSTQYHDPGYLLGNYYRVLKELGVNSTLLQ